jgi:hypothetical protein
VTQLRSHIEWRPCYRVVSTRFPPVSLFERVADPADWDAVALVEGLTNSRLRDAVGALPLVPVADRVSGPGSSLIMAPFTHLPPGGGRFSNGTFGAYYAARSLETAIRETVYHREQFLWATREAAMSLDMRVVTATLRATLHDVRRASGAAPDPAVYDLREYRASQAYAVTVRSGGGDGIVYDSVRDAGGECAAVFRPRLLRAARHTAHLTYVWDGQRIVRVYEKARVRELT